VSPVPTGYYPTTPWFLCFENVSVCFHFVVVVVVADRGCKNKGSLIEVF